MYREVIDRFPFKPNENLKKNVDQFKNKLSKMRREVWSPTEIANFRKNELEEIKRAYRRDIESEKESLSGLLDQFKNVYVKKCESDNQEKAVRYQAYRYRLSAMDDKEIEKEVESIAYSESASIPLGQLDVLVCELKGRKMKGECDNFKKIIREKRLNEPWLHLPESKPYAEMSGMLNTLNDNDALLKWNETQFSGAKMDDIIKELEK